AGRPSSPKCYRPAPEAALARILQTFAATRDLIWLSSLAHPRPVGSWVERCAPREPAPAAKGGEKHETTGCSPARDAGDDGRVGGRSPPGRGAGGNRAGARRTSEGQASPPGRRGHDG